MAMIMNDLCSIIAIETSNGFILNKHAETKGVPFQPKWWSKLYVARSDKIRSRCGRNCKNISPQLVDSR
jgi:hypothetical protein